MCILHIYIGRSRYSAALGEDALDALPLSLYTRLVCDAQGARLTPTDLEDMSRQAFFDLAVRKALDLYTQTESWLLPVSVDVATVQVPLSLSDSHSDNSLSI